MKKAANKTRSGGDREKSRSKSPMNTHSVVNSKNLEINQTLGGAPSPSVKKSFESKVYA